MREDVKESTVHLHEVGVLDAFVAGHIVHVSHTSFVGAGDDFCLRTILADELGKDVWAMSFLVVFGLGIYQVTPFGFRVEAVVGGFIVQPMQSVNKECKSDSQANDADGGLRLVLQQVSQSDFKEMCYHNF